MATKLAFDRLLFGTIALAVCFGLVMVYSSTVARARAAADGSVHLVLGGSDKGADFTELTETVAAKARRVYLIGETAPKIEAALTVSGSPVAPIVRAGTLDRAVAEAAEAARPGEVVLLSPACASFDQFDNFNHRGDEFQRLVKERVRERPGPAETAEVANG
jgi:UDP-N-acetylmuramoylalanine--D-glutamate ligase